MVRWGSKLPSTLAAAKEGMEGAPSEHDLVFPLLASAPQLGFEGVDDA